jgi:lipopolysaccharide export system ATP-binding protein
MLNVLEADSIRKDFGDKQILTDIYLKCQTGDIIGLLGRNGTGKSTLLNIVFGTLNADFKYISINGTIMDQPFKKKGTISFLNQVNFLPKHMTANKVVQLFGHRLDKTDFFEDNVLSTVKNTKIKHLSGGELRYLEIKIILNLNSKFIFLDEPFNGVAPIHIDIVKELIKAQSKTKGIILTDHDYTNVFDVANKYLLLFDGGLKILKTKQDFINWGYIPDKQQLLNT